MALYKYPLYLGLSEHQAFDAIHAPGATAPYSGIYRCESCGREIVANATGPLPLQNHHEHGPTQGSARWRLLVFAQATV